MSGRCFFCGFEPRRASALVAVPVRPLWSPPVGNDAILVCRSQSACVKRQVRVFHSRLVSGG